jgi:hypothetical protein
VETPVPGVSVFVFLFGIKSEAMTPTRQAGIMPPGGGMIPKGDSYKANNVVTTAS